MTIGEMTVLLGRYPGDPPSPRSSGLGRYRPNSGFLGT